MEESALTNDMKFAVVAETSKYPKPLLFHDLTLSKLLEDVVVPYNSDEHFFIDGVPLCADSICRIKVLLQHDDFAKRIRALYETISDSSGDLRLAHMRHLAIAEYTMRVEGILRSSAEDITTQVIRAYVTEIKPEASGTTEFVSKRTPLIEKTQVAIMRALVAIGSEWVKQRMGLPLT
jgi:hypothetical protein